jgi:RND family efflux transporter MFP subunit
MATAAPSTEAKSASQKRSAAKPVAFAALVAVALTGALTASTMSRMRQEQTVNDAAGKAATARPRVTLVVAHSAASEAEQVLPGSAMPLLEAGLYPRASGYIARRLVDIGDRVQKGQLLAVIDAPDLDDQLNQAKANLEQARAKLKLNEANLVLAQITLERSLRINRKGLGAVAQQEVDQEQAALDTSQASVETAKASIQTNQAAVQRFTDLQAFERIVAPFPGIITARHIDVGDLVSADSTARELFHLMRTDILRVFVDVPQVFATGIQVGQRAVVYRREAPLKPFSGKVTRTADALDPTTRTLRTEVQVANPENALRPGMYLQVKFVFSNEQKAVLIPSAAVVTRAGALRVAVLDDQHRVQYRAVQLGRDYGADIELLAGITAGDTVVVRPGDDLPEGTVVERVLATSAGKPPSRNSQSTSLCGQGFMSWR